MRAAARVGIRKHRVLTAEEIAAQNPLYRGPSILSTSTYGTMTSDSVTQTNGVTGATQNRTWSAGYGGFQVIWYYTDGTADSGGTSQGNHNFSGGGTDVSPNTKQAYCIETFATDYNGNNQVLVLRRYF